MPSKIFTTCENWRKEEPRILMAASMLHCRISRPSKRPLAYRDVGKGREQDAEALRANDKLLVNLNGSC